MARSIAWREIFGEGRGPLTIGILLVEMVAAIESLIVVAIMPAVKRDLGGLEFYGFVFSGYALAALAATPIAGRAADRRGPAIPFTAMITLFLAGTVLSALATSMPLLAAARIVQGYGAGGAFTVAYGAIARIFPEHGRARMLALLASAWIVPGLLGPSYGALLASTVGWRWAFFSIVPPTIIAVALTLPGLRRLAPEPTPPTTLSMRWPLQLAIGLGIGLGGLSLVSPLSIPAVAAGVALMWPSLHRVLPRGSLRATPGPPAVIAALFLLTVGFFAADYFVPLLITGVLKGSLTDAGIVVTLSTISWSGGSWWQSRAVRRTSRRTLMELGAVVACAGIAGLIVAAIGLPLWVPIAAWTLAGFGIGIAYPTLYLLIMESAAPGSESTAVSAAQTADRLALAVGGGVGGAAIAVAQAEHAPLALGLAAVFALALAGTAASIGLGGRLPAGRVMTAAETRARSG